MWPAAPGSHTRYPSLQLHNTDFPRPWRPSALCRRSRSGVYEDELEQSLHPWDRRPRAYSAGQDYSDINFTLKGRENSLLGSLAYERALNQVAHEETLNSLAALKTLESHFRAVCAPDNSDFLARRQSFGSKEDKKRQYRLSGVSTASSGAATNVSEVGVSNGSTSNLLTQTALPELSSNVTPRTTFSRGLRSKQRRQKSEMVLVAPMPTQGGGQAGPGDKDALLTVHETSKPCTADIFIHRSQSDEHGTVA